MLNSWTALKTKKPPLPLEGKTNSTKKISLCTQPGHFYQLGSLSTSYLLLLKIERIMVSESPGAGQVGHMCLSVLCCSAIAGSWEAVLSDPFYV